VMLEKLGIHPHPGTLMDTQEVVQRYMRRKFPWITGLGIFRVSLNTMCRAVGTPENSEKDMMKAYFGPDKVNWGLWDWLHRQYGEFPLTFIKYAAEDTAVLRLAYLKMLDMGVFPANWWKED
jgi:hypothetical protein